MEDIIPIKTIQINRYFDKMIWVRFPRKLDINKINIEFYKNIF